jgi:hypothetical protein
MNRSLRLSVAILSLTFAGCMGGSDARLVPANVPNDPITNPDPTQNPDPIEPTGRAGLELSLAPLSPVVSVGQRFTLEVQVRNIGGALASGVAPASPFQLGVGHAVLVNPPNPGIADIAAGDAKLFRFEYEAVDPGGVTFEVQADGTDIANDHSINAQPQQTQLVVQSAAMLQVLSIDAPAQANVGSDVTVKVTVSNGGQADAKELAFNLSATGAGQGNLMGGPPPAMALNGGASGTFDFTFRPTVAGPIIFQALVMGVDGNSRLPVTAEGLGLRPLEIDSPAALSAMASLPNAVSTGQVFVASLVVNNTGTAVARNVTVAAGGPVLNTLTGTAAATIGGAAPAPVDIPGGGSFTFRWNLTAAGQGSLQFSAAVTGSDANSNAPIASGNVTSNAAQVLAPTALVVSGVAAPATIGRGQPFNVTVSVRNNGGTAANNVSPTPSPLTVNATGGAQVTLTQAPAAQAIAAGATATFTFGYVETGSGTGNLAFSSGAGGVSATTGAQVIAPAVQSPLVQVVNGPALLVESVVAPARVSRGQSFNVAVTVRNTGGAAATAVRPALTFTTAGGATVTPGALPAAVNLAGGARSTFNFPVTAGTTSSGTAVASALASGTNSLSGLVVNSTALAGGNIAVQAPARLTVGSFTVPATVSRGGTFAVALRITNAGEADALNVVPVPSPPTATVTGGVVVGTTSSATAVTILGGQSQTFTWTFTETGTAPGTLAFLAGAQGNDANTNAVITLAPAPSNSASVETPVGCNGAALYTGLGGVSLDGDRLDILPGTDRSRVKPYAIMPGEYQRVLGTTPSRINNQNGTFDAPPARWANEQQLSAISLYQAYVAAFQGCLTYTASAAAYSANPTTATATTECANMQRRFWSRVPTAAESSACVTYATSTQNDDPAPRRRWAYVCSSVLASAWFLTN